MNKDQQVRDAFFEFDDILGQLSDAIDVVEALTKGTIANKAVNPLFTHLLQMKDQLDMVWPIAIKGAA